ncbi:MAG: alpha/beta hydrolase family protein [Pseudonocardiaceae bacterium]
MTALVSVTTPMILDRSDFVFSGNGRYGVCLRTDDEDLILESWTLTLDVARYQTIPDVAVNRGTGALPLDDGRILLFTRGLGSESPRCELALLQPGNGKFDVRWFGEISALLDCFFLPSPNPDQLGFMVTVDDLEHSTVWRLPASLGPAKPMMRVPGALTGGMWLDGEELVLGINQTVGGAPSNGITVDLPRQSWKRIWSVSDTSSEQILLYSPQSNLIIVSTNVSGQQRFGWARLGDPTVHFPETLHRPGYTRQALALDEHGERLLVHEVAGATSRLLLHTPADDHLEVLAGPLGRISGPASWMGNLVRIRLSAPHQPPTLATVRLGTHTRWSVSRDQRPDSQPITLVPVGCDEAELIELPGPAGPIEAIVYGGPEWRAREHLVVALHGGPLSAWRFEFTPLFHYLSAAGVAVVAPNYRGSTGYGEEHLRAVIGNWGGPDLDDILHLGKNLNDDRASQGLPRPVVLGVSYGAFLALLAACHEPRWWSACVALAPFLSGERFHDNASVTVRRRIEQLGGLRRIADAIGPRDVLRACAALSAPLLLMHGINDQTIPVEQSRTLRGRLLELGRTEDIDFEYVEVDSDHAGLIRAQRTELNQRVVRFCIARSELNRASSHGDGKWSKSPSTTRRR